MKKRIAIVMCAAFMAVSGFGQSAKLTAPQAGATWTLGSPQTITWTWSGSAEVKLVLFKQNAGKQGIIKTGLQLNSGAFSWNVGAMESGSPPMPGGGYSIRVVTMPDNAVLSNGPEFSIGAAANEIAFLKVSEVVKEMLQSSIPSNTINVSSPRKTDVWVPLHTYSLKWNWNTKTAAADCKTTWKCNNGCSVDAWLVPVASPSEKIYLVKEYCCPVSGNSQMVSYSETYSGIVPNLQSGKYFVRVARSDKPSFFGDSPVFAVQSTLSQDTAFLGPDTTQGQVDLALTNVVFDADGDLALKIKNLGDQFLGGVKGHFDIYSIGNQPALIKNGDIDETINAKPNEEVTVPLTAWGGFTFSTKGWDAGNPSLNIPSRFIPVNSRPFQVTVKITPANDVNPNNDWVSKKMCMIQDADIGTGGLIRLTFNPKESVTISQGTSNQVSDFQLKMVAGNTFAATLEVYLWNYGCVAKTFDCWLYVDDLPGQLLASGITLQPGHHMPWQQEVKIKVQGDTCGSHKLLFIADPKENGHEPYPNSYQNNFIRCELKIKCGGTITS